MMHKELKDKCALCGRSILSSNTPETTIEETIQNNRYKFDTRDCATMFKRLQVVYGNEFQPFMGNEQYIRDPFWDRIAPKENEIKEISANEGKQESIDNGIDVSNLYKTRDESLKNSFQVQKLISQLIASANENISLAIPTTAADLFLNPQGDASSFSCSVFFQQIKDLASANKRLNVKIITNAPRGDRDRIEKDYDDKKEEEDQTVLPSLPHQDEISNIQVKYIERDYSSLNENMVILVVDRKSSLAIELEEQNGDAVRTSSKKPTSTTGSRKVIKFATYSDNKSTVLSYISIFESLWKEIELNEKITCLLEEIKRRENIERDFIMMTAHELRTPIQPVLGLAQILQSKKNFNTKEHEELLSVIIRNARRLNILTENLLDLTKIENKTLKLQKEKFSLSDLIFEAISDMKSQLSSNQIKINVKYNDSSVNDVGCGDTVNLTNNSSSNDTDLQNAFLIKADKTRIMQVISNLLTNAIKFTKRGTIVISLRNRKIDTKNERESDRKRDEEGKLKGQGIEESTEEEEVLVSFKDSGTGIDSEIIGKLFEKFVTKSDKGTGLGLFVSRNIVEAHGGRMWAENNPEGIGATFTFSLPQKIINQPINS